MIKIYNPTPQKYREVIYSLYTIALIDSVRLFGYWVHESNKTNVPLTEFSYGVHEQLWERDYDKICGSKYFYTRKGRVSASPDKDYMNDSYIEIKFRIIEDLNFINTKNTIK